MGTAISPVAYIRSSAPEGEHRDDRRRASLEEGETQVSERVASVVDEMNRAARALNARVSFSIDQRTEKVVIRVIDGETNEVLRQIPPEEVLRIAAHMQQLLGIVIDKSF
jgi:flagellar protein FlaG